MTKSYTFTAPLWIYPGKSAWHFVSVPKDISADIDEFFIMAKRGWGSLKVTVTIGKTTWETSIFPDKKTETYLLPIKKDVRQVEEISEGDDVAVNLQLKS